MATPAEWSRHVEAWRASGQSAGAFCAARALSPHSLRYWSSRLGRSAVAKPASVRLARVVIDAPSRDSAASDSPIVVELGAARICVRAGFDPSTLAAVVDALRSRTEVR